MEKKVEESEQGILERCHGLVELVEFETSLEESHDGPERIIQPHVSVTEPMVVKDQKEPCLRDLMDLIVKMNVRMDSIAEGINENILVMKTEVNKNLDEKISAIKEQLETFKIEAGEKYEKLDGKMNEYDRKLIEVESEMINVGEKIEQAKCENESKFAEKIGITESKIEKLESKVDNLCDHVAAVSDRMVNLKQEILVDVGRRHRQCGNAKCMGGNVSFRDECVKRKVCFENYRKQDPIKFVKQLSEINLEIPLEWKEFGDNMTDILLDEGSVWFALNKRHFKSYEQFETAFKNHFCKDRYRDYLLDILTGNYLNFIHVNPIEYLTDFANRLIEIEICSEQSLCQRFAKHFGNRVYSLCINRKVEKLSEFLDVLNMFSKNDIVEDVKRQPKVCLVDNHSQSYNQNRFNNYQRNFRGNFKNQYVDRSGYRSKEGGQRKWNGEAKTPYNNRKPDIRNECNYETRNAQGVYQQNGYPGNRITTEHRNVNHLINEQDNDEYVKMVASAAEAYERRVGTEEGQEL